MWTQSTVKYNENNYNVYKLLNHLIRVEQPRKFSNIVQSTRCQLNNHTKVYYNRPFICLKCSKNHETTDCTKDLNTSAHCYHCDGGHTAITENVANTKIILSQEVQILIRQQISFHIPHLQFQLTSIHKNLQQLLCLLTLQYSVQTPQETIIIFFQILPRILNRLLCRRFSHSSRVFSVNLCNKTAW